MEIKPNLINLLRISVFFLFLDFVYSACQTDDSLHLSTEFYKDGSDTTFEAVLSNSSDPNSALETVGDSCLYALHLSRKSIYNDNNDVCSSRIDINFNVTASNYDSISNITADLHVIPFSKQVEGSNYSCRVKITNITDYSDLFDSSSNLDMFILKLESQYLT